MLFSLRSFFTLPLQLAWDVLNLPRKIDYHPPGALISFPRRLAPGVLKPFLRIENQPPAPLSSIFAFLPLPSPPCQRCSETALSNKYSAAWRGTRDKTLASCTNRSGDVPSGSADSGSGRIRSADCHSRRASQRRPQGRAVKRLNPAWIVTRIPLRIARNELRRY